jgi:hypothetical protein
MRDEVCVDSYRIMEQIKGLNECTRSTSAIKHRETHVCIHLISKSKSLKHQQSSSRKTRTNIHLRSLDSTTPRGSTWQTRTSDSYYNECQYQQISKTAKQQQLPPIDARGETPTKAFQMLPPTRKLATSKRAPLRLILIPQPHSKRATTGIQRGSSKQEARLRLRL